MFEDISRHSFSYNIEHNQISLANFDFFSYKTIFQTANETHSDFVAFQGLVCFKGYWAFMCLFGSLKNLEK